MSRDKVQVSKVSVPVQSCIRSRTISRLRRSLKRYARFLPVYGCLNNCLGCHFLLAAGHMEHPRDCHEIERGESHHIDHNVKSFNMLSPAQDNGAEDSSDYWALTPSPSPCDCLPTRSRLDDLVEGVCHQAARLLFHRAVQHQSGSASAPPPRDPSA